MHNVANGNVASGSTDAVNGGQLFTTNGNVTNVTNTVNNIMNGGGIKYYHTNSTANDSNAVGKDSTAFGPNAKSNSVGSIAGGLNAISSGNYTISLGSNSNAAGTAGIALGADTIAAADSTSIGAGAKSGESSTAIGRYSKAGKTYGMASGYNSNADGDYAVAMGTNTTAADRAVAMGANSNAGVDGAALGNTAVAGVNAVAIGPLAKALGKSSISMGDGGTVAGANSISIGTGNVVNGNRSGTFGDPTLIDGDDSYAIGNNNKIDATSGKSFILGNNVAIGANLPGTVVLGDGSTAAAAQPTASVTLNGTSYAFAGATPASTVSVGAVNAERQIQNVAAGRLNTTSTDAVNGSQLNATNTSLNSLSTTINNGTVGLVQQKGGSPSGGDITVGASTNGTVVDFANSLSVDRKLTHVAQGVISANSTDAINGSQISAIKTTADNSVQYDNASKTIVTLAGPGTGTKLGNVADGTLSTTSKDAVNGSQLNATNTNVTNLTNNITDGLIGLVQQVGGKAAPITVGASTGGTEINMAGTSGNRKLVNVAAGTAPTDAVNFSQLSTLDTNAVKYDDATKGNITLGGAAGTKIGNVADGTLSTTSKDAVNGSQLNATNTTINNLTTNIVDGTIGLVQQVGGKSAPITVGAQTGGTEVSMLGTAGARKVTNVAAGTAATDAVNVSQLSALDANAVKYDDASKTNITLGGGVNGTKIGNVANGALNATSKDAVNGSQLFAVDSRVTNIIGGTEGLVQQVGGKSAPITVGAQTGGTEVSMLGTAGARKVTNVADGLVATGSKDAVNGGQLSAVRDIASNSVQYDNASKTLITLGGAGAGVPTTLTNVKRGALTANSSDAVNGAQLFETNANVTNVTNTVNNIMDGGGIKYFHANSKLADSTAVGTDSVAIGPQANARYANSVAIGASSETGLVAPTGTGFVNGAAAPASEVSIGSATQQRRLTNLAAGSADTDAVNVAQLKGVTGNINTVIGQTVFDPTTGKAVAPVFTIQGNTYGNVTNAFNAVDKSVTNITNSITNGAIGPVQYSSAGSPNVPNGGIKSNDVTLVGLDTTKPVGLHNVAAGLLTATSTDAINGGQLNAGLASVATNLGGKSEYNTTTGVVTAPTYIVNSKTYNNVGSALEAIDGSISGGKGIKYFHANSTLADSSATGTDAVAIGPVASATKARTVAMGANAAATADDAMALGAGTKASAANSVALGNGSEAARGAVANYTAFGLSGLQNSAGEVSVGSATGARQITNVAAGTAATDAVNMGQLTGAVTGLGASLTNILGGTYNTTTGAYTGPTYITYGNTTATTVQGAFDNYNSTLTKVTNGGTGPVQYSDAATPKTPNGGKPSNDVTLVGANASAPVGLHNVAAGSTTADSTDAVNGSQINKLASSVATNLGGNSTYDSKTGTITAPTYNLQGGSYNNVGGALSALDGATTRNSTAITNITNGTSGIVRQEGGVPGAGVITVGKETGGTKVDFTNNAGAGRVLTGVAGGELSATSKDAVNGSQLYQTNEVIKGINGGAGIKYFHANSTGADSKAVGTDSIAVGPTAVSNGAGSVAIGSGAQTAADSATAVGKGAQAGAANSVALGAGSVATRGAETYRPAYFNNGATFNSAGTVSVGSEGAERVISNVAPGVRDTDAANVGQVKGLAASVEQRMNSMQRGANRAIASTAALSFQPVQQHPGQFVMSAGAGHYQGETAVGVGGNYLFQSGRQKVYAGVASATGGKPVIQVGFSAAFGD